MTQHIMSLWVSSRHGTYAVDVDVAGCARVRDARVTRLPPILAATDFSGRPVSALLTWLRGLDPQGLRVVRLKTGAETGKTTTNPSIERTPGS